MQFIENRSFLIVSATRRLAQWPTDRDFESFKEWFHYEYVEEGFDTMDGDIEKE